MSAREWFMTKLEAFALEEVSSRPLGIMRIFASTIILHEFSSYNALHRVDGELASFLLNIPVLICVFFALFGYKTRWAFGIMAVAYGILHMYFGLLGGVHVFAKPVQVYQVIVLMWLTPSGRSLSVDRYLENRRAAREGREPEPERMPWWQLELFLLQICSIYFWAAENKSDPAWLRGERWERYYIQWYGSSDAFVYEPKLVHYGSVFMAWSSTILEWVLTFGLLIRRIRPYVWVGGIMLHMGIFFMFSVAYFTSMMLTMLIAALPPQWLHDLIEDMVPDPS